MIKSIVSVNFPLCGCSTNKYYRYSVNLRNNAAWIQTSDMRLTDFVPDTVFFLSRNFSKTVRGF